jgi:nucleotide-binding universal stress UspA family protein
MTFERILCPVDFSETSVHAIEHAVAIANWSHARLSVLHAYPPIFVPVPGLPAPASRPGGDELARARERACALARAAGATGDVEVRVEVGHPAAAILDSAASLEADLVVIGTHGATGIEHLILGSVAERVLRKASCPVLTVPPRVRTTSRIPFGRVLCAIDFGEWSSAALRLSASVAEASGAALDLVHVVEWPWQEPPPPDFGALPRAQADALLEFRRYLTAGAETQLRSLASAAVHGNETVAVHVAHGKPYTEILRVADVVAADLLTLGVHGRSSIDLALFGSTTNQVIRRASCPVLTVRK